MSVSSQIFPKRARLLKHADFDRVYKNGRRHLTANLSLFFMPAESAPQPGKAATPMNDVAKNFDDQVGRAPQPRRRTMASEQIVPGRNSAGNVRIGLTVGRALGHAVARNRIKRRVREAVRRHLGELALPVDVVINPRKSAAHVDFAQLESELSAAFAAIARSLKRNAEKRQELDRA